MYAYIVHQRVRYDALYCNSGIICRCLAITGPSQCRNIGHVVSVLNVIFPPWAELRLRNKWISTHQVLQHYKNKRLAEFLDLSHECGAAMPSVCSDEY